jgi:hypothetical protein
LESLGLFFRILKQPAKLLESLLVLPDFEAACKTLGEFSLLFRLLKQPAKLLESLAGSSGF